MRLATGNQGTCFGLPLALAVMTFGIYEIIEGFYIAYELWYSPADVDRTAGRVLSVIDWTDGITAVIAALTGSASMALTAVIGFCIDAVAHLVMIALRFVAFAEVTEVLEVPHRGGLWYLKSGFSLFITAVLLWLSVVFIQTSFSFYQVLMLGGNGWEGRSPNELMKTLYNPDADFEDLRRGETDFEHNVAEEAGLVDRSVRYDERVYI